ncbi:MAG: homocysteine S-methyltransferase family protein [Kiloniellaceae bacterium]
MTTLQDRLTGGEVVILDGAMGTELQRRGVPMDEVAWSAAALKTHPDTVRGVHEDYIRAGAEIVITNTFAAVRHVLAPTGLGAEAAALNRRAVELAREARDRAGEGRPIWIAGSISNFNAGDDKASFPTPEAARANYREQAESLADGGADLIMLEMMQDTEHSVYAAEAAAATGLPVWVGFSCRIAEDGRTVVFRRREPETSLAEAFATVMATGGSLAGVMHSDVAVVEPALKVVFERWAGPVAAYPHSGHFVMPNWQFVDVIPPEDYAAEARRWLDMGAQVIGGCCGIGPDHIRLLKERLAGQSVPPRP